MEAQLSATCPPSSCSLGAVSGILATLTFPPLHRALGLVATGGLSIWLQLACVAGATLPSVAGGGGRGGGHLSPPVCGGVGPGALPLWAVELRPGCEPAHSGVCGFILAGGSQRGAGQHAVAVPGEEAGWACQRVCMWGLVVLGGGCTVGCSLCGNHPCPP